MFGVVFVVMVIVQVANNYKNAIGKERFSVMDIVDEDEAGNLTDIWGQDRFEDTEAVAYKCVIEEETAADAENMETNVINFRPYC